MSSSKDQGSLLSLAQKILEETYHLVAYLKEKSIKEPDLCVGSTSDVWATHSGEIEQVRTALYGLTRQMNRLLEGPHGFLHEYVASNWDHGALYVLLEFGALEKIPLDGSMAISELAAQVALPESKLLCIMRLNACEGIVKEVENEVFGHTAISEALVRDPTLKAFIGFQLFETRVSSAHLADTLREKPNDYWTGLSAFHYAWGSPMYDWHRSHPAKESRFQLAMQGVAHTLDPGYLLLVNWFEAHYQTWSHSERRLVVEIETHNEQICKLLSNKFPGLTFETEEVTDLDSSTPTSTTMTGLPVSSGILKEPGRQVFVYLVHNILWNKDDEECIKFLRALIPVLRAEEDAILLVNELLSPLHGSFEPHIEKAYRRRDVTLTAMHNVKQRTEKEWVLLFKEACSDFLFGLTPGFTSHSSKGLWEITLGCHKRLGC